MVREKWFVDKSPSGAAPAKSKEEQACRQAGAMQVCGCHHWCLSPCVCACAWCGSKWMDPARCVHTLLQVPQEFHLPRLDSTGPCQGPGGQRMADKQAEIERAKPKPREEGGCQCGAGALSRLDHCFINHSLCLPTIHAQIPPHAFARSGCEWCTRFPNPLSEAGLTNTSSNESHHHHDHDHATNVAFCLYLTISPPNRAEFPP